MISALWAIRGSPGWPVLSQLLSFLLALGGPLVMALSGQVSLSQPVGVPRPLDAPWSLDAFFASWCPLGHSVHSQPSVTLCVLSILFACNRPLGR